MGFGSSAFLICSSCSSSSFTNVPQIVPDDFLLHPQLFRGLLHEHAAMPRGVEIEGIDVEAGVTRLIRIRHQQVDLQEFVAHVLGQAPDTVAAVAPREDDVCASYLGGERFETEAQGQGLGISSGFGIPGPGSEATVSATKERTSAAASCSGIVAGAGCRDFFFCCCFGFFLSCDFVFFSPRFL